MLIPSSETDPEMRNYIPSSMESRIKTDEIENEFGVQDIIMLLFTDSTILTEENLRQIKNIDRGISKLSGISRRISPFTTSSIKSSEGMMIVDPLIKTIPSEGDTAGINELYNDILNNPFARNIVFSSDMTSASITATINNTESESVVLAKVDSVVAANTGNARIMKGGLPYIRLHIMKDVKRDAIVLVPLALIVMLLVLKLTLGEWRSVFMPFSVVLLSTGMCMGLIPLIGWKLSIITLLVPILLIAVGNNYGIYLVTKFHDICRKGKYIPKREIINEIIRSLKKPLIYSGLTTIAGILGLLTHSIIPARQMGVLAAAGVLAALIMSILLIPGFIYIRSKRTEGLKTPFLGNDVFKKILNPLAELIIRYPGHIILYSVIFTIVLSSGMSLLKIETNQENYFPKNNPVRQASDIINRKFGGSQTISVMIAGDIKDPVIMRRIDELTRETEHTDGVGQVFSISQAVREMSKAVFLPEEDGYDQIPSTRESIAQLFELYNMSGNYDDFSQMLNLENTRAHVLIKLSDPSNVVIKNVNNKIQTITKDIPAEVTTGGYAMIMADFARSIIKGQIFSLGFALITVFILLSLIFKSFRGGLTGSIPLAVSILILFGFMGFTGIALDAATALLSSIMIGVGVDFTIQYIWSFSNNIRNGLTYEESTRTSLRTIGRSIIINALTVMAGFSVLVLSGFSSIRFFGYLVLISIGSCLVGAIILIPAIIMKFRPGFVKADMNTLKKTIK